MVVTGGWPKDESVFDGARTLVFFMDGGGGHPMIQGDHLEKLQKLMDKGVGLVCLHYAVEVPKGEARRQVPRLDRRLLRDRLLDQPALDGRHQEPARAPDHAGRQAVRRRATSGTSTSGSAPTMKGVTPILVAKPDDRTREGVSASPRGPYQHIVEAKGRDEVLAWAVERPDGGRGFGFTGAHVHKNWGDPNFRKLVLNAILWTAKLDVPPDGVETTVTPRGAEAEPRSQGIDAALKVASGSRSYRLHRG